MKLARNLFVAVLATALLLSGCGGKKMDINPADAAQALLSEITFRDTLVEAEGDVALQYYQMDDKVTDFAVYISGSSATAEEIAVIKTSDLDAGKKILEKRLDELKFRVENYVPTEMAKIESPVIAAQGDVVVMVLADDAAQAQKAVDKLFQ